MRIPIVDENDNIIRFAADGKKEIDLNPELIYRASSLWITNSKNQILLAKRALSKVHDPGKWGPAVAGTVEEGETYESNIVKEAEEELGLKNIKPILGEKFRRRGKWNYFGQQFNLILDKDISEFKIQEDEVEQIKWFTKIELTKEVREYPDNFLKSVQEYVKNDNKN